MLSLLSWSHSENLIITTHSLPSIRGWSYWVWLWIARYINITTAKYPSRTQNNCCLGPFSQFVRYNDSFGHWSLTENAHGILCLLASQLTCKRRISLPNFIQSSSWVLRILVAFTNFIDFVTGNGSAEQLKQVFTSSGQSYGGLVLDLHSNRLGPTALFHVCLMFSFIFFFYLVISIALHYLKFSPLFVHAISIN